MSISIKKSSALIVFLLFIFIIEFILKMFVVKTPGILSCTAKYFICIAPVFIFFLYLIGDLHDLKHGCAKTAEKRVYFTDRTIFKNTIFIFADLCVLLSAAIGVIASLFLIFFSKDPVVLLELLRIWFLCFVTAYIIRLKYRNSYIYLLFTAVSLSLFGI